MFTGIVKGPAQVLDVKSRGPVCSLKLQRPHFLRNLEVGDSISVNGVCLTVEAFDDYVMEFVIGPETMRVTGWPNGLEMGTVVNLEPALRLGDPVNGHLVTGHVDDMGVVATAEATGDALELEVKVPNHLLPLIWKKGSIAINGVSLTVNAVAVDRVAFCLIPETLRRTNLGGLGVGQRVTIEVDNYARAFLRSREVST